MVAQPDYTPIYQAAGQEWNVDPLLLQAVAGQEHGGVSNVSPAGAQGHMQIMPATQRDLGVTDPNDVTQSIFGGAKYLSQMLDKYQSAPLAVAAYNAGPGRIDQHLSNPSRYPLPAETAAYVPGVTARYQALAGAKQQISSPSPPAAATTPTAPAVGQDAFSQALSAPIIASGGTAPSPPSASQEAAPQDAFIAAVNAPAATTPTTASTPPAGPQHTLGEQAAAVAAGPLNILSAAAQGAKEGFGSEPLGMGPNLTQGLRDAGIYPPASGGGTIIQNINEPLVNALAAGGDLVLRTGGALLRGGQAAVAQLGAEAGMPELGRDLAALPEAFPTGEIPGVAAKPTNLLAQRVETPRPVVENALAAAPPTAVGDNLLAAGAKPVYRPVRQGEALAPGQQVATAADGTQYVRADQPTTNALTGSAPATVGGNALNPSAREPVASAPSAGMGGPAPSAAPVPNSVGAAASSSAESNMTPAQIQAYRSTAEGQKLLEPQQPGIRDANAYVPGVLPNTAEIEQSVNTARELKALKVTAPAVSQEAQDIAFANNEKRQQFFQGLAGSPVDVENMNSAASAQAKQDLAATFGASDVKAADTAPVISQFQQVLDNPRGRQNDQLQAYVKPLLNKLVGSDGVPKITDAEELYGFREQLARMTSKASQAADPNLQHVSGQLGDLIGATDQAIEAAAPGYRNYMDNYAASMRAIDEKQSLQGFEKGLFDGQSRMTYNKVQSMMRQIVDSRQSPGLNPYKSITDDTMGNLFALRDDLRRSASAQELARTPGSDTAQNAFDIAKSVGKLGAEGASHLVAAHLAPVVGNFGVAGVKNMLTGMSAARTAKKGTARGMAILRPDPSQLNLLVGRGP